MWQRAKGLILVLESACPMRYTAKGPLTPIKGLEMSSITSTAAQVGERRVVLNHVSWETYEHLLADHIDASSPRFTYDQGMLEIVTLSSRLEELTEVMAAIAELVAEERGVEFINLGSTTFRRQDLKRGLEPERCLYLQNVERIRGKEEIDLLVDPPPDLVIEIEITNPAVSKLPIYALLGVSEIWLTDGQGVRILRLAAGEYKSREQSEVLPLLSEPVLSDFLERSKTMTTLAWRKMVRHWHVSEVLRDRACASKPSQARRRLRFSGRSSLSYEFSRT
jgi:Uma2 family endonuclease